MCAGVTNVSGAFKVYFLWFSISVRPMQPITPEEVEMVTKGPLLVFVLFWWWRWTVMGRLLAGVLKRLLALVWFCVKVIKIAVRIL